MLRNRHLTYLAPLTHLAHLAPIALILLIQSCKVIQPPVPKLPPSAIDSVPLPESNIDVPISIDLDSVFADLDRKIPAQLSGSGDLGPGQYRWSIRRPPFQLSLSGTSLDFTDQAHGSVEGYIRNPLNNNWKKVCDCSMDIDLGFNANFSLSDHYSLAANVALTRFDARACNLSLVNLNVTPIIQPIATESIHKALADLNNKINQYNIQHLIRPYWAKLFQPIKISDLGYLSLNPSAIRLEGLTGSAHLLSATIGITAQPVFSLANPGPPATIPPLPTLSGKPASGFNVYVDARIQYEQLNQLLKTHVDNTKMPVGKNGYLLIKNAEVFGTGNQHLLVRIDFKGRQNGIGYKGRLYFTCIPIYDPATGLFYISDIDFDSYTRSNLLAKAGDWILNSALKKFLNDQIHFNLGDQLNGVKDQLNAAINKPIGPNIPSGHIDLSGHIDSIALQRILPVREGILLRFHTAGALSVTKN